jgi:hypothetical protein
VKYFFKPSDFDKDDDGLIDTTLASRLANEKLNKLIESMPVVYGNANNKEWIQCQFKDDTHKARLAFVEEIVKEPCAHEPIEDLNYNYTNSNGWKHSTAKIPLCKYCGVELQATWSEVSKGDKNESK